MYLWYIINEPCLLPLWELLQSDRLALMSCLSWKRNNNNQIITFKNAIKTMAITAKKPEGDFKKVEPGNYVARCYRMIEIGTLTEEFKGKITRKKKVQLTWELPTELEVFDSERGEEPFSISKMYTLSLHEDATLRKDLESWRGQGFTADEVKAFDITKLLGVPCMLNIIHKPGKVDPTKTYAEIGSISRMPKGLACPNPINPSVILSYDNWNQDVFNSLSDFMKAKIEASEEYKQMNAGGVEAVEVAAAPVIDPLPF